MAYKPVPGTDGIKVVARPGHRAGEHSADSKTWTYKLQTG